LAPRSCAGPLSGDGLLSPYGDRLLGEFSRSGIIIGGGGEVIDRKPDLTHDPTAVEEGARVIERAVWSGPKSPRRFDADASQQSRDSQAPERGVTRRGVEWGRFLPGHTLCPNVRHHRSSRVTGGTGPSEAVLPIL